MEREAIHIFLFFFFFVHYSVSYAIEYSSRIKYLMWMKMSTQSQSAEPSKAIFRREIWKVYVCVCVWLWKKEWQKNKGRERKKNSHREQNVCVHFFFWFSAELSGILTISVPI